MISSLFGYRLFDKNHITVRCALDNDKHMEYSCFYDISRWGESEQMFGMNSRRVTRTVRLRHAECGVSIVGMNSPRMQIE